jgi:hypothetical protein
MLRMDTISSAEFRKRYAKLTQPTRVTVLGRVIGEWLPRGTIVDAYIDDSDPNDQPHIVGQDRYDARPVTAVPKKRVR